MTLPATALAILAVMSTPAPAASQQDEDACRPDVFRLCAAAIPDENEIVACLNRAVPKLSPACRIVIAPEAVTAAAPDRRKR